MPRPPITLVLTALAAAAPALADDSNISPAHKHAWCENTGWLNWRDAGSPAGAQGARFAGSFASGFVWGENIGWINLDDAAYYVGLQAQCLANCDGSTVAPILNVNDFICFQARFAAGDPYANCDGSTVPPVLNVNDFICFQSLFAAGCP